jgi:hypothetical protein
LLLLVVVALALAGQTVRAHHRVRAAQLAGAARVQVAAAGGRVPAPLARAVSTVLAEARRLDPVAVEPRAYAADLLVVLGRFREAAAAYAAVVAHEPRAESFYNWGIALDRSGDRAAAVTQWRRAVTLAPRLLATLPPDARAEVEAAPLVLLAPTPRAR